VKTHEPSEGISYSIYSNAITLMIVISKGGREIVWSFPLNQIKEVFFQFNQLSTKGINSGCACINQRNG
jgi:hypothetical protein